MAINTTGMHSAEGNLPEFPHLVPLPCGDLVQLAGDILQSGQNQLDLHPEFHPTLITCETILLMVLANSNPNPLSRSLITVICSSASLLSPERLVDHGGGIGIRLQQRHHHAGGDNNRQEKHRPEKRASEKISC